MRLLTTRSKPCWTASFAPVNVRLAEGLGAAGGLGGLWACLCCCTVACRLCAACTHGKR
jgi:hypothetical protein